MCTNFHFKNDKGSVLVGRSMDNERTMPPAFYIHPRGKPLSVLHLTLDGNGSYAESQNSIYGYVGVNINSLPGYKSKLSDDDNDINLRHIVVDGLNEKGLSAGFLYMPGTKYQKPMGNSHDIKMHILCHWVLANYASVDEVKQNLPNYHVYWYEGIEFFFPFYLAVVDKTGASIVIEFKDGEMVITDNPVGVSTNEPWFDWHLENLNNYAFLHPYTQKPFMMGDHQVIPPEGGGSLLMPSQGSSVGRFIRTAYQKHYLAGLDSEEKSLSAVIHILNSIDHSPGIVLDTEGPNESIQGKIDVTRWSAFKHLTDGLYALRIYDTMRFFAINLSQIDFAKINVQIIELPQELPYEEIRPI